MLTLKEVRLRTLDICLPPASVRLESWLRPQWHCGVSKEGSVGVVVRDAPAPSGSLHVRVRDAYAAADHRVQLPADLSDAPVRLPEVLAGSAPLSRRVAVVDLERVIRGVETTAEVANWLKAAHEDLDRAFESVLTPEQVVGLTSGVTHLTVGYLWTCAVHNGAAKCWGDNFDGTLGNGTGPGADSNVPVNVTGLSSGVSEIQNSVGHSCARIGTVLKCWGGGGAGELGDDTTDSSNVPVNVVSFP